MTKLKPTKDWILTQEVKEEEQEGLIKLVRKDEPTKKVRIISFGPGANKSNLLKEDDIVLVPVHTGLKHEADEEEFEFAKEHNFLGVVE